ncbi:MAG: RNA polymerase sigma factor [Clostridia bacterium]|nr:RNA polymerase sigma factor [Clostridia bacterium]
MDNGAGSYRRFLAGDEDALVEIVSQYRPGLQNYIHSIVNNIAVAEDLTEDTFVKLLTKKPKNKGMASFKTWLYTIGRNLALDWMRKNAHGRYVSIDEIRNLESDEQKLAELYFRDEERKAVREALNHINPEYKHVLMLFYFEDFGIEEIARILKKTKKNTSVLLHRARNALKNQLIKENFMYEIR